MRGSGVFFGGTIADTDKFPSEKDSRAFVSRQHIFDDGAFHIGEPIVTASVPVRQLLVIESHQMQNCRVKVMHVNRLFDRAQTVFVSRSVDHASFDSGTGQP